jgi:hypothetical protein
MTKVAENTVKDSLQSLAQASVVADLNKLASAPIPRKRRTVKAKVSTKPHVIDKECTRTCGGRMCRKIYNDGTKGEWYFA